MPSGRLTRRPERIASGYRNRITLVNGAELKQLIKEYLHKEVIPGASPPKRLCASDNAQTGCPEPAQP